MNANRNPNQQIENAVDSAISAWLSIGVGAVLGAELSWWFFPPMLAISCACGWHFIDAMVDISLNLPDETDRDEEPLDIPSWSI